MIKTLIVDDQALVRGGLRAMLEAKDDIEVVGEAADGLEAVEQASLRRPHVVLMDIRMPRMDGIEATRRMTDASHAPKVLMLTTFDLDEYVYEAMRAGAAGFLLKDTPPSKLADGIRTVMAGEALLAPAVTRRLLEHFVRRPAATTALDTVFSELTSRELDILRHVTRGLSNREIASTLFLSEATVKTHVTRILAKLGVRGRVQAVVLAYETGLVQPGG
ncbi:MAG: response regulator [Solirubrobacteraceae bacterium]